MIYLLQNKKEYDYDVRAIALAFFEREKIKEISREEWDNLQDPSHLQENEPDPLFLYLKYSDKKIEAEMFSLDGRKAQAKLLCDYENHENSRNEVGRFLYQLFSDFTGRTLPWGMLTGIRPTKIIMKWMEEESDAQVLEKRFADTYLADEQKASLCRRVALKEKSILTAHPYEEEYSLYIGIPFCPTTCLYCSFTSFPASRFGDRMGPYLEALFKEMEYVAMACKNKKLSSIYVGGGTPTALDASSLKRLMDKIHELFPVESVRELTVEAGRPDSITREKLQILKDSGVERISINPQTMHQSTLDLIGRAHTVDQTRKAFALAKEVGFDVINMDIITGLPGEDITHIEKTLEELFQMKPDNLTVHSLAIKRAANLNIEMEKYRSLVKGSTNEMLRLVDQTCSKMGMEPYYMYRQKNIPGNLENIGYSTPGKEGLYNILIMEEKQDIIACGAGASTKFVFPEENRIERTENVKNLDHYIQRIDEMIDRKRVFLEAK